MKAPITQAQAWAAIAEASGWDVATKLERSQAERIAELERESETHAKAYGLAIVERDNLHHELKVAQEGWRCECSTDDACRFARERDALRAQLATIAATEPHYWEYKGSLYQSKVNDACEALFTRPMPAQDVTELVELTDAQILTLWEETYVQRGWTGIEFARAIERAHGIGAKQ